MLTPGALGNAHHYDAVLSAWSLLLGKNLHYGYFETGAESLDHATARLTEKMMDAAGTLDKGSRVLDIGCGTGEPAAQLARRFECKVTGISPSRACVESAGAATSMSDLGRLIDFQIGDAQALQFSDESFDLAWIMESSHLIQDKALLFSEARRVLKPGGGLVLCDIGLQAELALADVIARRDDFLLLNQVFGRALMKTPRHYAALAAQNGMRVGEMLDLSPQTAPTFDRWKHNAELCRDEVVLRFGEAAWQTFDRSIAVLKRFWAEGVLGYFMMTARRE